MLNIYNITWFNRIIACKISLIKNCGSAGMAEKIKWNLLKCLKGL